ncbi:uncharacterized protein PpBr36_09861 [Pyricularia pennisetigena]|uniref:uncharacterized protein n=1 Tax=Pyricularia pennisetigena TaxID=1578925 RepID=UPI001150B0A7|nr:uncharacterized protein PpBr36_09861 [Pyricularia pennisetigena]TLS22526.1 hypothetical protein PpBr36_09861 [Pyricularia pennisetigena]
MSSLLLSPSCIKSSDHSDGPEFRRHNQTRLNSNLERCRSLSTSTTARLDDSETLKRPSHRRRAVVERVINNAASPPTLQSPGWTWVRDPDNAPKTNQATDSSTTWPPSWPAGPDPAREPDASPFTEA